MPTYGCSECPQGVRPSSQRVVITSVTPVVKPSEAASEMSTVAATPALVAGAFASGGHVAGSRSW
jgi:hypothetical protein